MVTQRQWLLDQFANVKEKDWQLFRRFELFKDIVPSGFVLAYCYDSGDIFHRAYMDVISAKRISRKLRVAALVALGMRADTIKAGGLRLCELMIQNKSKGA